MNKIVNILKPTGMTSLRAAGCTINDSIENAKMKILEEALKEI